MKTPAYMAILLAGLALTACKPTPRTAPEKHDSAHQKTQQTESPAPAAPGEPANTPAAPSNAALTDTPSATEPPSPAPSQEPINTTLPLLEIATTHQDYNLVRPWEKDTVTEGRSMGVYLGDGKVLTYGEAAKAATYLELRLPDGSQTAAAKVLRYNQDLNLALLTVVHEQDTAIFESRQALELSDPLTIGDEAEFWGSIQGIGSARVRVHAESSDAGPDNMPCLKLKASAPIPSGNNGQGLPIVRNGKLCALTSGYDRSNQVFSAINAELIKRFLTTEHAEVPVLGIRFTETDDPVFRRYLKLGDKQGGLYITDVIPESAAQTAGIQEGDVLTAIEDMPIDTQGRCRHPYYGTISAAVVLRSLKPCGEHITLSVCRNGEQQALKVALNRDAQEHHLLGQQKPGVQPRYIVYGGLLFQPLTAQYLATVLEASRGSLPLQFLGIDDREAELRAEGRKELVALTLIIPTPATLSYEGCSFCLVEKVNGRVCTDFAHFAELLDEPTENGLITLSINKPPYTIVLDRKTAETCNKLLQSQAIPKLRSDPAPQAQTPGSTVPHQNAPAASGGTPPPAA